jgi:alpha-L-fucosidase
VVGSSFNDTKRQPFTSRDIRFTTQGDILYAIALGWPDGELLLRSLSTYLKLYTVQVGNVQVLGSEQPVHWRRDEDGLHVRLAGQAPTPHAVVLKITPKTD